MTQITPETNSGQASASQATATLDLEAYFRRIGYTGEREANLDTLRAIVLHHTQTIPFENLNPLLRWPVRLDLASLQQKLVRDGRGGYCFEHNLLLSQVLQTLGFQVTQLAARVMWNVPEEVIMPRSHMLLRLDLGEQSYIVDVGFGGLTLTGVLRLEPEVEQVMPHEPFRLITTDDMFVMQAKLGQSWQSLYRFDLQRQYLADYEVTSWYLCHHPTSHFTHGLIAARPAQDRRYALRNNVFTVYHRNGKTEQRTLNNVAALRTTLAENFHLTLPDVPEVDAALQRLLSQSGQL
jgi:N-hydroxyarylamine O-acetyltransferase